MEFIEIRVCSKHCLGQVSEHFSPQSIEEDKEGGKVCSICGQKYNTGFLVEIYQEEVEEDLNEIECCSFECVERYTNDFGSESVKMILPQNNHKCICSVCGNSAEQISFKLVVSEPQ